MKRYYEAYDRRYAAIHEKGMNWFSDETTRILAHALERYCDRDDKILEIGCGEGRDAIHVLKQGYDLLATDISEEAISFCRKRYGEYSDRFVVLDAIDGKLDRKFDFIYAVAVMHMLTEDEDRRSFLNFIYGHLKTDGKAFICAMGDGTEEKRTDPEDAFRIVERNHVSGKVMVTETSCRIVKFDYFIEELQEAKLAIIESGIAEDEPEYGKLMWALVGRK